MVGCVEQNQLCNMSCDSNDDELKLTKEYTYLLTYIRPFIDQLNKSRDAQLCLLWLSKLEQCTSWEKSFRNKILLELCKQVKTNCLKPPFNSSPPSGPLRNVICMDWKESGKSADECSEVECTTEDAVSSSSNLSPKSLKNMRHSQSNEWKVDFINSKNRGLTKPSKEALDHSECFAIQKAYHERTQSDQMVIERYQDIIKSLVSQQLKADISPNRLKKLQSTYGKKIAELVQFLKEIQEENCMLRRKIESATSELNVMNDLKTQNENLRQKVLEIESANNLLEAKYKKVEEEKLITLTDLIGKLNESEKKLKETEKLVKTLERKDEENYRNYETEYQNKINEREKAYCSKVTTLERLLEEKEHEINILKEEISNQCTNFEEKILRMKEEFAGNSNVDKNKKIKALKKKVKKFEKVQERMIVLFQSQLQQIVARKDFYIATLEMQLKMNNSETAGSNQGSDIIHQKVSNLESEYRKLLEETEMQSLKRRQLDLQKIHNLEKQLLLFGGVVEDTDANFYQLKTHSETPKTVNEESRQSSSVMIVSGDLWRSEPESSD